MTACVYAGAEKGTPHGRPLHREESYRGALELKRKLRQLVSVDGHQMRTTVLPPRPYQRPRRKKMCHYPAGRVYRTLTFGFLWWR